MKDTVGKLSNITISLHWIVAATIIGLIIFDMSYPVIHQSLGMLMFIFIILRVIWRLRNGWPTPASTYQKYEQIAAKTVHWLLLIGTLILPISGMLISGAGGHGLDLFGWEILAPNLNPADPEEVIPLNKTANDIGHMLHNPVSNIMLVLIFLHVAAALKHHFLDKDNTLRRMINFTFLRKD